MSRTNYVFMLSGITWVFYPYLRITSSPVYPLRFLHQVRVVIVRVFNQEIILIPRFRNQKEDPNFALL